MYESITGPAAPDTLKRVTAYAAGRYHVLKPYHPDQARGFLTIFNQCGELERSSTHPAREVLHWLSQSHADLNLRRACQHVLEHLGNG